MTSFPPIKQPKIQTKQTTKRRFKKSISKLWFWCFLSNSSIFSIHAYHFSLWFFFILDILLKSMLEYSLFICVKSYFYLRYKREFNHANHETLSIKTNTNCMNLLLHNGAMRQYVCYDCCSQRYMNTKITIGINIMNWWILIKDSNRNVKYM